MQAEHAHEQQHVERRAELERVQGPEIHRHPAPDHANHGGSGHKVDQPGQQQRCAYSIALAHAGHCARYAHQRWHQAQNADD